MIFDKQRRNTLTGEYLKAFPVPDSRFHTYHKALQKHGGQELNAGSRLVSLLHWIKTTATWKTVIDSMQSLRMDNFRVVYTRFLVFLILLGNS